VPGEPLELTAKQRNGSVMLAWQPPEAPIAARSCVPAITSYRVVVKQVSAATAASAAAKAVSGSATAGVSGDEGNGGVIAMCSIDRSATHAV
jgi:hypothetical protein